MKRQKHPRKDKPYPLWQVYQVTQIYRGTIIFLRTKFRINLIRPNYPVEKGFRVRRSSMRQYLAFACIAKMYEYDNTTVLRTGNKKTKKKYS